jgi:KRAB domain-containing zinc finger protein
VIVLLIICLFVSDVENSTLNPENKSETEEKTENENSTSYKCKVCDKTFSSKSKRYTHISRTHKDVIQSLQCNICNKSFTKNYNVTRHIRFVHSVNVYKCEHCNFVCKYRETIINHLTNSHIPGIKLSYQCTNCDKSFTTSARLKRHKKVHDINKNIGLYIDKYTCCNDVFTTCVQYLKHSSTLKHRKLKENQIVPCNICFLNFSSNRQLQLHKISEHDTFYCAQCPCTFTSKKYLEKHIYLHQKPTFKCKLCNLVFDSKLELNNHNVIHKKVVPKPIEVPKPLKFKKYIKITNLQ